MLQEDNREKRRIGSGIHSRTGTRGYVGVMRTAVDLVKGKDKRIYKGTGKVKRTFMIPTFEEFQNLSDADKLERLTSWRKENTTKAIAEKMGIPDWKVFELFKKYNVPTKSKAGNKKGSNKAKDTKSVQPVRSPEPPVEAQVVTIIPARTKGLALALEGVFSGKTITEKILKLASVIEDEENNYRISLLIEEEVK